MWNQSDAWLEGLAVRTNEAVLSATASPGAHESGFITTASASAPSRRRLLMRSQRIRKPPPPQRFIVCFGLIWGGSCCSTSPKFFTQSVVCFNAKCYLCSLCWAGNKEVLRTSLSWFSLHIEAAGWYFVTSQLRFVVKLLQNLQI